MPRRKRASLGIPEVYFELIWDFFLILTSNTKVTCSLPRVEPNNTGMYAVCKLCTNAYVDGMPGNCLLPVVVGKSTGVWVQIQRCPLLLHALNSPLLTETHGCKSCSLLVFLVYCLLPLFQVTASRQHGKKFILC